MFFFEKKNQKTFVSWCVRFSDAHLKNIRVFCFFSPEKKFLPGFLPQGAMRVCDQACFVPMHFFVTVS
jgi:hypothetical protein